MGTAALGLAVPIARLALVALGSAPRRIGVALTLFQPLPRRPDHLQALLTAGNLGGHIQVGFIALSLVGRLGPIEQRLDLRLELNLGALHPLVAHRTSTLTIIAG